MALISSFLKGRRLSLRSKGNRKCKEYRENVSQNREMIEDLCSHLIYIQVVTFTSWVTSHKSFRLLLL